MTSFAPLNPPARLLLGPGPSMVSERIYQALSRPIVGHLDPYFFEIINDIRTLLRPAFGSRDAFTVAISGTGSAGMETAVSNFVEPGSRFVVFANGFFCDRISEMGRRQGAEVIRFEKPWGETYADAEAEEFIHRQKPQTVAFVHAETSTGAAQKGAAICRAAREAGALVIADCVTSLATMPIRMDETGIDVAYSCTQKGLGCPPGLSPVAVSQRAMEWLRARKSTPHTWYMDLKLLGEYINSSHRYHHTASATMFYALREALVMVSEEGLGNRWRRHELNHQAFVAGAEAMGLTMHVAEGHRIWALNTPRVPAGVDDVKVRAKLLQEHGIEISGGFGPLAGQLFRIGFMGTSSTRENVLLLLEVLEAGLREQGYEPPAGGKAAAEEVYAAAARA